MIFKKFQYFQKFQKISIFSKISKNFNIFKNFKKFQDFHNFQKISRFSKNSFFLKFTRNFDIFKKIAHFDVLEFSGDPQDMIFYNCLHRPDPVTDAICERNAGQLMSELRTAVFQHAIRQHTFVSILFRIYQPQVRGHVADIL